MFISDSRSPTPDLSSDSASCILFLVSFSDFRFPTSELGRLKSLNSCMPASLLGGGVRKISLADKLEVI